ncbi:hypothetical protein IU438_25565 [Nocardia cyriacigeorgica]|nr:hypothetical protein C5B73_22550 [Nocardia cyriacigeorgica]MBF6089698.1 hypothetical protein [Nocardia cyriacigeorgica]MBF6094833.1 hypothetical protein [Nocardia cyriacigeorgica]MBF6098526.1 hypothetical protein [Nocardia cyriacigeorgica]MBF6160684.1 hypothetical protein [Nocardia cyriacigeorgica]
MRGAVEMSQPFRTPRRVAISGSSGVETLRHLPDALRHYPAPEPATADCGTEPPGLTYRQAREILRVHEVHGPRCRQWLAAAAYLSAGLDDE